MGKKRQKRSFKKWKKQDPTAKMPGIQVVPSSPNAKVARIIDRDQRHFAAKPGTDWLLRPCVPGEFDEIASSGEMDLSTISYTLVKRMGPNPEQLRIPMTEEMAQSWLDFIGKSGNIERSKWMGE
jgi:hypothetical protein